MKIKFYKKDNTIVNKIMRISLPFIYYLFISATSISLSKLSHSIVIFLKVNFNKAFSSVGNYNFKLICLLHLKQCMIQKVKK